MKNAAETFVRKKGATRKARRSAAATAAQAVALPTARSSLAALARRVAEATAEVAAAEGDVVEATLVLSAASRREELARGRAELERRAAEVYPAMPGFSATAPPPFGAPDATAFGGGAGGGGAPAQLPDALRGEAWAFVQLPLEELAPELDAARRGDVFGAVFEVDAEKDKSLPSAGTPIPGKREESLFSLSLGRGREIKEKREPRREKR